MMINKLIVITKLIAIMMMKRVFVHTTPHAVSMKIKPAAKVRGVILVFKVVMK